MNLCAQRHGHLVQRSTDVGVQLFFCLLRFFRGRMAFLGKPFYQSLGFVTSSAPYDDFGVPHIDMIGAARSV